MQKIIVGAADDIDDGVAKTQNIVAAVDMGAFSKVRGRRQSSESGARVYRFERALVPAPRR